MTKIEALKALKHGYRLTHEYFTSEEWVQEKGYLYEFEDGCLCSPSVFWNHRQQDSWNDNWSLYSGG